MTTLLEEADTPPAAVVDAPRKVQSRRFRPDIEGLRAVAVLLVVLYHVGFSWLPGGYVGVDVFFVISGFLITSLLVREFDETGRVSISGFYARRARRILPIASLVLVATLSASSVVLSSIRLGAIARDGLWVSIFGANFHFASSGAQYLNATAPPSPLQHYWSLAVEEQFYVVWPLLLWGALILSRKLRRGSHSAPAGVAMVAIAASLLWSIHQTDQNANAAYFSPFTRGWELMVGALAAILATHLTKIPRQIAALLGWSGIGLIAYSAVTFDSATPFPGSAALMPVLGSAAVLVGGLRFSKVGPELLLGRWPMRKLGGYSYSLYLWHWPILIITEARYPHLNQFAKVGFLLGALGVSAFCYHCLENPVRHNRALRISPARSLAFGAAVVAVSLVYANMYVVGGRYIVQRAERLYAAQQSSGATSALNLAEPSDVEKAVGAADHVKQVPSDVQPPVALAAKDIVARLPERLLGGHSGDHVTNLHLR